MLMYQFVTYFSNNTVYDLFMGSGNLLVNLFTEANLYVGNDIVPLLPNVFNKTMGTSSFKSEEIIDIIKRWDSFTDKSHYYKFRDYWNKKYLSNQYDKEFVYETILLLKMCSNSMVRFNRKEGYFNQGFRGIGKGKTQFFSDEVLMNIIKSLNNFKTELNKRKYEFYSKDFKELFDNIDEKDLLLLDPPYLLSDGMYGTDYTDEDDLAIFDFLKANNTDFILFNYLNNGDRVNENLKKFIEICPNVQVETINTKNSVGQGRANNQIVTEVMVYRIK